MDDSRRTSTGVKGVATSTGKFNKRSPLGRNNIRSVAVVQNLVWLVLNQCLIDGYWGMVCNFYSGLVWPRMKIPIGQANPECILDAVHILHFGTHTQPQKKPSNKSHHQLDINQHRPSWAFLNHQHHALTMTSYHQEPSRTINIHQPWTHEYVSCTTEGASPHELSTLGCHCCGGRLPIRAWRPGSTTRLLGDEPSSVSWHGIWWYLFSPILKHSWC